MSKMPLLLSTTMTPTDYPAVCDTCSSEYRVPDSESAYSCTECDGEVRAVVEAETLACPSCNAEVQADDLFCSDCGEAVKAEGKEADSVEEDQVSVVRSSGKKASRRGRKGEERHQASRELVKAFGVLKTLRIFFVLSFLGSILTLLVGLLAFDVIDLAYGTFVVVFGIEALSAAVMLMGARMILFRPFFWSVVLASLVTLTRAIAVVTHDFQMTYLVIGVIWAGLFWFFVPMASRVRRLIADNPDLHIARLMHGVSTRRANEEGTDFEEAHRLAERRAQKKSYVFSGVVLGISITGFTMIGVDNYLPSFDSSWEDFKDDWSHGRLEEVVEYFPESQRKRERHRLEIISTNRGWGASWPVPEEEEHLYSSSEANASHRQIVEASLASGEFSWSWSAPENAWQLNELKIPAPDFASAETEWLAAWNDDDIDRLAEMFENPESSSRSLSSMARRRDWDSLPPSTDSDVQGGGERMEIILRTSEGAVLVRFRVKDDAWVVSSVKPPKR